MSTPNKEAEHVWTMFTNGLQLAKGWAPTLDRARSESMHYALQYVEEGPTQVTIRLGRKIVDRFDVDLGVLK